MFKQSPEILTEHYGSFETRDELAKELAFGGFDLEEEFPIHFGSPSRPFHEDPLDDGGDFGNDDPFFDQLFNEISASECAEFMAEQDARTEMHESELLAVETAPLRHQRKKRWKLRFA